MNEEAWIAKFPANNFHKFSTCFIMQQEKPQQLTTHKKRPPNKNNKKIRNAPSDSFWRVHFISDFVRM